MEYGNGSTEMEWISMSRGMEGSRKRREIN
jgi:hypothetical protein